MTTVSHLVVLPESSLDTFIYRDVNQSIEPINFFRHHPDAPFLMVKWNILEYSPGTMEDTSGGNYAIFLRNARIVVVAKHNSLHSPMFPKTNGVWKHDSTSCVTWDTKR